MIQAQRILFTGGPGFIGSEVLRFASGAGFRVLNPDIRPKLIQASTLKDRVIARPTLIRAPQHPSFAQQIWRRMISFRPVLMLVSQAPVSFGQGVN